MMQITLSDKAYSKIIRDLFSSAKLSPPGEIFKFSMEVNRIRAPFVTAIWFNRDELQEVALEIRQTNPKAFGPEQIGSIIHRLKNFVVYHYQPQWFGLNPTREAIQNYGTLLSDQNITDIKADFMNKFFNIKANKVLAVPIKRISCSNPILTDDIAILSPQDLIKNPNIFGLSHNLISAHAFPIGFSSIPSQTVTDNDCWIITKARTEDELESLMNIALGAIWARLHLKGLTLFSGGDPFHGRLIFDSNNPTYSTTDAPIRMILDQACLDSSDAIQIHKILASESGFVEKDRRRTACEFIYHFWSQKGVVAFSNAVISFDALFGEQNDNMRRISRAVLYGLNDKTKEAKTEKLLGLRNSVIHGGNSSVTQSSKYFKYVRKFKSEPQRDVADILCDCINISVTEIAPFAYIPEQRAFIEKLKYAYKILFSKNTDA